ncbi:NlpC/P60 family protein [Enterococcus pseudoavium]|uniref:Peptidoglycan hydrolase n=2 Tax=Enterococcus pseudoavium TaxID=44007 RepID=A0ABU3FF69_9ENTE|nr:NlpC/P60 family protein [Enterococcus pseudoavium]MDT2754445.1 NlpC/P60 family protein [Enterococcus pseudoavium]MDT2769499.1 NlpC/P60 family protein [Enterococcus pseudoavium]
MSNGTLTRRQLRQQKRQKTSNYRYLKKGSTVLGTALVTASVAAPLLNTHEAEAVEGNPTATTSNVDKKAFIKEISSQIKPLAEKHDLYASIMIAQAIIESDWGSHDFAQAPYYNLFGLEGQYQGQSVMLDKKDVATGQTEKKELKKYGSYKEAIQDYIEIIKTTSRDGNENYFSGVWRSNAKDYQTAAAALEGRFTEDQGYVQKLVSTIQENNLSSYDATEPVTPPVAQPAAETPAQAQEYTVQSGDTVNSITDQFGIGVKEFTDWNKIDDSNIYAGQTVIVGNGEVKEEAPVVQAEPAPAVEAPVAQTPPVVETTATVDQTATDTLLTVDTVASTSETPVVDQLEQPAASPVQPAQTIPAPDQQVQAQEQQKQQEQAQQQAQEQQRQQELAQQQAQEQQRQQELAQQQAQEQQRQQELAQQQAQEQQRQQELAQQQAEEQQRQQEQAQQEQQATETSRGQQIVDEAGKYIGTPYVWGGKDTSGFDCSGLTQYVYKQVTGKDIGGWTVAQESAGSQISVGQAQAGDLLFWGDQGSSYHVAISAGGDQYIHAPQPGENVKYGSTQYYTPDFGVRVY